MNYDPKGERNKQLYKLKRYSLAENLGNEKNIGKLAEYVAKIHSQNIDKENFEIYNAQWIIKQVSKIEDNKYKSDIITALEAMAQVEIHNALPKKNEFLVWDIIRSDWQKDYQSGKAGSFAWDVASIINVANDPQFSEIFLTSYLRHGGQKLTITALYANLYYVKVFEVIKNEDFENIVKITREIIDDMMFNTDIILYETLLKLNIIGY